MASIWKPTRLLPDGRRVKVRCWYIAYRDPATGRRVKVKGYTDRQATVELGRRLERDAARRAEGLPVADGSVLRRPLTELVNEYLADLKRAKSPTRDYLRKLRLTLQRWWKGTGWTILGDVKPATAAAYLAARTAAGKAARTTGRDHEALAALLNWCVRMGLLATSPIQHVARTPRGKSSRRKLRRPPTLDEYRRLRAAAPAWRTVIYSVAALSGLRGIEIRRLQKRDCDPHRMRWTIRPEITKNRQGADLPMLAECAAVLRPIWDAAGDPTTLLLPRRVRHNQLVGDCAKARITRTDSTGRTFSFHGLRYFFCAILAEKLPMNEVKRLMRHASIQMTADLYGEMGLRERDGEDRPLPKVLLPDPAPPPAPPE